MDIAETTKKKAMTKDEIIQELMDLLKQNNMSQQSNGVFEICSNVDGLEKKLDSMTEELSQVRKQIKEMQEDTILNNLKAQIQESAVKLQTTCTNMKEQLFTVKENIHIIAVDIINGVKLRGKEALSRVSEFMGIKNKLIGIRENVKQSQIEVASTIVKVDAFGAGIREANQKIANTFRTFADKEVVDYSMEEKKLSKTDIIKKPFLIKKVLLSGMELRLDAAIDKVDNLSRDVEIGKMLKQYDEAMERPHDNLANVTTLVAEPEQKYGAEVFEESIQSLNNKNHFFNTSIEHSERSKGR
ncbi:MAG: DUF6674 family protein [Anaerostipes sp.]